MKTKQALRILLNLFKKNKKTDLSKTLETTNPIVNLGSKSKFIPCSLKHTGTLLSNPTKIAET